MADASATPATAPAPTLAEEIKSEVEALSSAILGDLSTPAGREIAESRLASLADKLQPFAAKISPAAGVAVGVVATVLRDARDFEMKTGI
jgi:hypothetical protein